MLFPGGKNRVNTGFTILREGFASAAPSQDNGFGGGTTPLFSKRKEEG